jgi:predicted acyltransferase
MSEEIKTLPKSARVVSLDALRGFDMFWIIGGGKMFRELAKQTSGGFSKILSSQLYHTDWQGFTAWDLIMPLFLFIVGAAMPFSFHKRLSQGQSRREIYLHVIKRTIILFILGMMAQGSLLKYDLSKLNIYSNTLQAIAAGYLFSTIIMLNMGILWQIATTAVLLLLFWGLMVLVPVPGFGPGVLTPEGNLAIYIEKLLLGPFKAETSYTWILSSITFVCTVMLGVMAGEILRSEKSRVSKFLWLSGAGLVTLVLGWLWNLWFPIIKHLWTSSFVLYAGGWSFLLLALFYIVIDIWGLKKWAFGFVVIGTNAIAVYMATELFDFRLVGNIFVGGLSKWLGSWSEFLQWAAALVVIWLILFWMYRKKTFIKI